VSTLARTLADGQVPGTVTATYGSYTASSCTVTVEDTAIECTSAPGYGAGLAWTVVSPKYKVSTNTMESSARGKHQSLQIFVLLFFKTVLALELPIKPVLVVLLGPLR
jgi:hypothetical protein